jgi:hypothetical protein
MKKALSKRGGYALLIVLAFVLLFVLVLGVAYQQMQSALLVESVLLEEAQRDEGSVAAVARGVTLLETGLPPSDPYVCGVTIQTTTGPRDYVVTFTSNGSGAWTVEAAPEQPGQAPVPMPTAFFSDSIP